MLMGFEAAIDTKELAEAWHHNPAAVCVCTIATTSARLVPCRKDEYNDLQLILIILTTYKCEPH